MTKSTFFFAFVLLAGLSLSACSSAGQMQGDASSTMPADTPETVEAPKAEVVYNEDVAALVAKHLEARGGVDNIKSIETMKWEGGAAAMGMDLGLTLYFKRPGMVRTDINIEAMGAQIVQAYDGETAWMINPMGGSSDAQALPPEMAEEMADQGNMDGYLVDYADKGADVTFVATEDLDGRPAFKLKVVRGDRGDVHLYLDAETFLEVREDTEGTNPQTGEATTVSRLSSDYRM